MSSSVPPSSEAPLASGSSSRHISPQQRPIASTGYRSVADLIHPPSSPPAVDPPPLPSTALSSFFPSNPALDSIPSKQSSLSEDEEAASSTSSTPSWDRHYTLSVIQQPLRAAEFGTGVLSRLPVSPPLIVRLEVRDGEGRSVDIDSTLPFLFCHLSLLVEPSSAPRSTGGVGPGSAERADLVAYRPSSEFDDSSNPSSLYTQSLRLLYGTLVSSPHQLPMSTMERKVTSHTLFVFPDVSIRARGRYRLRVGLMRIAAPPGDPSNPPSHESLASVVTDAFDVTALGDYVAPSMTAMTGSLAEAGVQMYLPRSI